MKVDFVCSNCGSNELIFDAAAQWDTDSQKFILITTYESRPYCRECDGETREKEILLSKNKKE